MAESYQENIDLAYAQIFLIREILRKFSPRSAVLVGSPLSAENREKARLDKPHSSKTILVVDDDPKLLAIVTQLLVDSEYNVLTAVTGSTGLEQSRSFKGEIHLLLSDFQMPGMSGVDLATVMSIDRPQIKVLLMSGFDDGMLILNEGWHFLAKPFVGSQLRALIKGLVSPELESRFSPAG